LKIGFLLFFFVSSVWAGPPESYPMPPVTKHSLFYLQRSLNSNTIVYDANINANGKLNAKKPVIVYWMRYNSDGARKKLNFAERNFAYGLTFDPVDDGSGYMIYLMAYSERDIKVSMDKNGQVAAHTIIAGKPARLKRIYIDVSGSGFWSSVNFIELKGIDLQSGKDVTERFDPDDE